MIPPPLGRFFFFFFSGCHVLAVSLGGLHSLYVFGIFACWILSRALTCGLCIHYRVRIITGWRFFLFFLFNHTGNRLLRACRDVDFYPIRQPHQPQPHKLKNK